MLNELKTSPRLKELKEKYPLGNLVVILMAIVMIWRGIWGLLDKILFPGMPFFSYVLSLVIGAVVLYLDDFKLDNLKR